MCADCSITKTGYGGDDSVLKCCLDQVEQETFCLFLLRFEISVKTTQQAVFVAAKALLDHISSALCGLRDSLPENFSPEGEELLISALQRSSSYDCHVSLCVLPGIILMNSTVFSLQTQASTNAHMLADSEPFRVFLELLKCLHSVSASFRSSGGLIGMRFVVFCSDCIIW